MSLPSFPSDPSTSQSPSLPHSSHGHNNDYDSLMNRPNGSGAGNLLPRSLLIVCGVASAIATVISFWSIYLQLKSYRRPILQRAVVRIMIMVPIYAIASIVALFSLDAAFFIDTVRDLYEAFVIYTFFQLLVSYLGGERSLLILLHGRQPIPHPFPFNLVLSPMDISDPWVLLNLKRGILQYVQLKPILVLATVILKAVGLYREGDFSADSGYTYISVLYNGSICLSLYCLAMFWVCVNRDLQGFRPLPKFLCVKGILFFSFWQGLGVSLLVAVHAIKKLGAYTDPEHMSLALTDSLVCLEMPIFAIAHQYAFQASDYIDSSLQYCARMPVLFALRDAFGGRDVWEDTKATLKGRGISYKAYEPAEGTLHVGEGRRKRIRAGLRYSKGGTQKYWISPAGEEGAAREGAGPIRKLQHKLDHRLADREGYAPLLPKQQARIIHHINNPYDSDSEQSEAPSVDFDGAGPEDQWEESMYSRAKKIEYVGYPNVDVSREEAKRKRREEEDGVLAGRYMRRANGSFTRDAPGKKQRKESSAKKGKQAQVPEIREQSPAGSDRREGQWSNGLSAPKPNRSRAGSRPESKAESAVPSRGQSPKRLADVVIEHDNTNEEWLYDGDVERDGAWQADGSSGNRLKVTRTRGKARSGPSTPVNRHLSPPRSPFEIGEADDVSDPEEDEPVRASKRELPSDAVDLLKVDDEATTTAQTHEREKGDPNLRSGEDVLVRGHRPSMSEYADGQQHEVPEDHYVDPKFGKGRIGHPESNDIVRETTPPPIIASLQHAHDDDDNPWQ